jgi:predicted lipoprotein with Yx(FWY)xxD motif
MKRSLASIAAGTAVVALVAAGCGGSNKSSGASQSSTQVSSKSGAAVSLRSTGLGKVLVGPNGRTLYLFEKDKGGKSACSGACASEWPPLTVTGKPAAGSGVDAAKLSVTKRSDGKSQVVYSGHPLYFYIGDSKPGDTNGQGLNAFGAEWYVLSGSGSKVEKENGSGQSGSSSGGSSQGGYHYPGG